jgi:hypothetical protein
VKVSGPKRVQFTEKLMLLEVMDAGVAQHLQLQGFDPGDAFIDMVVRAVGEYPGRVWAWLAVIIVHDRKYIRSI